MASRRLSRVQRELLDEFASGRDPDRFVNPGYRRTADVLVRHGYLARTITWGWYAITEAGRVEASSDD